MLAIEPMVNAGGPLVRMGDDGWSVFSEDDSLAAHFEFTVAVTPDGVFAASAPEADLRAHEHVLEPLWSAGTEVVTQIRLHSSS